MRAVLASLILLLAACKGPVTEPGDYMMEIQTCPTVAAADKALVFVHRPRAYQGHPLYLGVWLNKELLATLGNGHTTFVELDPGAHTFIGRSVEVKTVIHANLEAGKIYDLRSNAAGAWIASFRLKPIDGDDETWEDLPVWTEEHRFVALDPAQEADRQAHNLELAEMMDTILSEAAAGDLETYTLQASHHRP